ncbi:hypothetical protein Lal_00036167 [Lupinus albus]|nr:hypothetical protein Lal_00036167 [Lupinus albus]
MKVLTFAWRLFQDRIPTMDALVKRGVTLLNDGDSLCVLCKSHPETATHLFSSCNFSYSVWQLIYNWLGITSALPFSPINHYSSFLGLAKDRKRWKLWSIIWITTIWVLWLARNDFVFNNTKPSLHQILNSIKVKSWLWTNAHLEKEPIHFDD